MEQAMTKREQIEAAGRAAVARELSRVAHDHVSDIKRNLFWGAIATASDDVIGEKVSDWPPVRSAIDLPDGERAQGSTGQWFVVRNGQWVRESTELDNMRHRRQMQNVRQGLRNSSAIIRIQHLIDRNEEISSRVNWDQALDVNVDGHPCKIVVSKHSDTGDKIICCVYRAVPTMFGRFCMKDHMDEQGNVTRKMQRHDFGLIEKHFGVGYDAMPSRRYVVNASAYINKKAV